MSETKRSYSGIIFIIIAIIAFFVIFKPFGGDKIEGEWNEYSKEYNGQISYLSDNYGGGDMPVYTFRNDGTLSIVIPDPNFGLRAGRSYTHTYSYSDGRLAIDGEECDCKISGKTMTWTYDNGIVVTFKRS